MTRNDDFESRRVHLRRFSDDELHAYFWELAEKIVEPLVAEARTHTSPSIERSVLLRMGFSSLESKALVDGMHEKGLLAHGAGHLLLNLANRKGIPVRELGLQLIAGEQWEDLGP
jgi:D-ornithine 4,5-aminomutase subunit alpha